MAVRVRFAAVISAFALTATACGGGGSGDDDPADDGAQDQSDDSSDPSESDDSDDSEPGSEPVVDDDSEPDTGGEPDEPLTASWRGVTPESIHLGVAMIDTEALAAFDVDLGFGPVEPAVRAWNDAINADGGINGRKLELTIELFLPVGSGSAATACTRLIEDAEVFLVVGTLLDDNPLCITEQYETPYLGLSGLNAERQARSVAPFFAVQMDEDRQFHNSITVLADDGTFDGKRVALWWEDTQRRLAEEVVDPLLADLGVNVVERAEMPFVGLDVTAANAAADTIMEKFRVSEADLVVNLSGVVQFSRAVERSGLDAELVFISGQIHQSGLVSDAGFDPAILDGAIGVTNNTPTREEWLADSRFQDCIDTYNATGPDEPVDLATAELSVVNAMGTACRGMTLARAILVSAGPQLTPETLLSGAETLESIDLPGMPGASLGPGKYSAGNAVRFYEFDRQADVFVPASDLVFVSD